AKGFEIKLPQNLSNKELIKLIKQTEKQMKAHVAELEFEKAAICRDELKILKDLLLKDGEL
ncbi:MAG: UvrB/UvrC motif-containing protein, partial [Neisseriaceae bacterium]